MSHIAYRDMQVFLLMFTDIEQLKKILKKFFYIIGITP